jgi:hypothetical protein
MPTLDASPTLFVPGVRELQEPRQELRHPPGYCSPAPTRARTAAAPPVPPGRGPATRWWALDLTFVVEAPLQLAGVARRQGDGCHLGVPRRRVRADLLKAGQLTDRLAGVPHQRVALLPHPRPVVLRLELDRRRDAQVGRNVAGALPLLLQDKWRSPVQRQQRGAFRLPAPADYEGFQQGLRLLAGIEKATALGAVQPLVALYTIP